MKNENTIDLVKFLFSLLIVAIHVPILCGDYQEYNFIISNGIARIGVPFFFIAGSYFLFKKLNGNYSWANIKGYFLKLLRLYCVWSVIYFIPSIALAIFQKHPVPLRELASVYLRNFLFEGISFHLWYLNTTIVCTFVFILLLKSLKHKSILFGFSLMFFAWGGVLNTYYNSSMVCGLISAVDLINSHTYTMGFTVPLYWMIFIYFGFKLSNNEMPIKLKQSCALFTISIILLYCELSFIDSYQLSRGHSIMMSLAPCGLFIFVASKKIKLKDAEYYKKLRHLSTLIYLLHPLVWLIINNIYRTFNIENDIPLLSYTIVVSITLLLSMIIIKLSKSSRPLCRSLSTLYK